MRHGCAPGALTAALLLLTTVPARACDPAEARTDAVPALLTAPDPPEEPAGSGGPATRTERTVEAKRGASLELSNFSGDIVVRTAGGSRERVVASHSPREHVVVRNEGSKLVVECESDRMVPASVHYDLTVPDWMDLDLSGVNSDITIEGVKGEVKAETVQGDIDLVRASGKAVLTTVQGEVRVERSRGPVEASAINGPVRIEGADGSIQAESVNGDIVLDGISSDSVDASTVNGPVRFAGRIQAHGLYRLASHNGSIRMAVPVGADARVVVSTYRGGFESSFPVNAQEKKKGREYVILLGSGGALVNLESFQGRVLLYRPGEPVPGESDRERDLRKDAGEDSEDDD